MTLKDQVVTKVLCFLSEGQVTEYGNYVRSKEYKGFYLRDDSYLYPYSHIEEETKYPRSILKETMMFLRNEGYVELVPAVTEEGVPNGSGWSLTEKGLHYVVDSKLITL